MDNKLIPYTSKVFNADILKYLNVDSAGDVVTAETWVTLWTHMLEYTRVVDTHLENLIGAKGLLPAIVEKHKQVMAEHNLMAAEHKIMRDEIANMAPLAEKIDQSLDVAAQNLSESKELVNALRSGLVHYGEEPPTSDEINLWIKPAEVTNLSGVYVGPGEMPEECNVQIDITGDTVDMDSLATKEDVTATLADYTQKQDLADYIVETGVTTGSVKWNYEKWNSGKIVCWCHYAPTFNYVGQYASTTGSMALVLRFYQGLIPIPTGIKSINYINGETTIWNYLKAGIGLQSDNSIAFTFCTPETPKKPSVPLYVEVKGKWK